MIAAIHTFGELLHFHPHLHALVTDGVFTPDGTFIALPALDDEPFEKLWQKKVFDLLLKRGKISEALVTQMRGWMHSGFAVHHAVRLDADDRAGRERLAHYMLRCPLSLERMIRVTGQGTVIYRAEKKACRHFPKPASPDLFGGVRRNFQVFDPLDFIAELTQHIPEPRMHLVRYFGWYSNKSRGMRAKTAGDPPREQHATRSPSANAARRRWAALIKRVWQVDPLRCPHCGSTMKIVSFIEPTQPDVIQKILAHCGLADEPPRAPPNAPPPEIRELRYVTDLDFVQDPGPDEPAWSAD